MKMKKYLLIVIVAFLLAACHAPIKLPELEENINYVIEQKRMAGVGVAIFDRDQIHYAKGFGKADLEAQIPYTTDTRQVLASISKTFIGVALMKCQELGLLDLDDPINKHLPFEVVNPHFPNEVITIKHLATHTASFKYSEKMTDTYNYEAAQFGLAYIMENFFAKNGLWYDRNNFHSNKPGDIWDYSNAGASLAAFVVEQASNQSFDEFVQKYIFKPLKMHNTVRHQIGLERAKHYDVDGNSGFALVKRKEMGLYPVGDYLTSVNDMISFFQMVMNKGELDGEIILSPASVEEMLAAHQKRDITVLDSDHDNQGIFWWHESSLLGAPPKVKGHLGGDYGIFSAAWLNPKNGLTYILLSNTGRQAENADAYIYVWQSLFKYGKRLD